MTELDVERVIDNMHPDDRAKARQVLDTIDEVAATLRRVPGPPIGCVPDVEFTEPVVLRRA